MGNKQGKEDFEKEDVDNYSDKGGEDEPLNDKAGPANADAQNADRAADDSPGKTPKKDKTKSSPGEVADADAEPNEEEDMLADWKRAKYKSFETIRLISTKKNPTVRPCGFRNDGTIRKVKDSCLLGRIRQLAMIKNTKPKVAVCITMYNEDENLLKWTLRGIIQNYNAMYSNDELHMRQQDMVVCVVVDGYDKLEENFKQYAREHELLDERILEERGFMYKKENDDAKEGERDWDWKMRDIKDVMAKKVKKREHPKNLLHMFQVCTWNFGLENDELRGRRINFIFGIKHKNDGKINSHKWFFQGVCKFIKPEYTLMLDCGTRVDDYGLCKLYKYMTIYETCGGCCGEIEVDLNEPDQTFAQLFIRAAQYFEYKLSHSPDKACESFYGFNSVLPGAYCLFRWEAIQSGPMDAFFKLVNKEDAQEKSGQEDFPSCSEANEYLAEDRVMCLQIYLKDENQYQLTYIPDAKAFTDAPGNYMTLLKQRRRWMNGALFAAWSVLGHILDFLGLTGNTTHPCYRGIMMLFFMTYYMVLNVFSLAIVGSTFVATEVFFASFFASIDFCSEKEKDPKTQECTDAITEFFTNPDKFAKWFPMCFSAGYGFILFLMLIIGLSAPLDKGMPYVTAITSFFSAVTLITMGGMIWFLTAAKFWNYEEVFNRYWNDPDLGYWYKLTGKGKNFIPLTMCGTIMFSIFAFPAILRPIDFITHFRGYSIGFGAYLLMLPGFINVMNIYSMCNLHDLSWGNRPSTSGGTNAFTDAQKKQAELKKEYEMYRVKFLMGWLCGNAVYIVLVKSVMQTNKEVKNDGEIDFLVAFSFVVAYLAMFRFISALFHILRFKFRVSNGLLNTERVDLQKQVSKLRERRGEARRREVDVKDLVDEEDGARMDDEDEENERDDEILDKSLLPEGREQLQKTFREKAMDQSKAQATVKGAKGLAALTKKSMLEKTHYNDVDDDDAEFEDLNEEEQYQETKWNDASKFGVDNVSKVMLDQSIERPDRRVFGDGNRNPIQKLEQPGPAATPAADDDKPKEERKSPLIEKQTKVTVRKGMGFIRDKRRRRPPGPTKPGQTAAPATHNVFKDGPSIRGPSGGDAGGARGFPGGDANGAGNEAPANFGGAM